MSVDNTSGVASCCLAPLQKENITQTLLYEYGATRTTWHKVHQLSKKLLCYTGSDYPEVLLPFFLFQASPIHQIPRKLRRFHQTHLITNRMPPCCSKSPLTVSINSDSPEWSPVTICHATLSTRTITLRTRIIRPWAGALDLPLPVRSSAFSFFARRALGERVFWCLWPPPPPEERILDNLAHPGSYDTAHPVIWYDKIVPVRSDSLFHAGFRPPDQREELLRGICPFLAQYP